MDSVAVEDFISGATRAQLEDNIRAHYLRDRTVAAAYAALAPELSTSADALQVAG